MASIRRIQKMLQKQFGSCVTAGDERGCLVLRGRLEQWDDVVRAGFLAAKHGGRKFVGVVNHIECSGVQRQPTQLPTLRDTALQGERCDVLVVGAGVVGCAIARQLSRHKLRVLLVDKEHDVGLHASARNDGMVHPGIDLRKNSEKYRYNRLGNARYDTLCAELGVPFVRSGQYLCFSRWWYRLLLPFTLPYWRWMGIPAKVLGRKRLFAAEPHLNPALRCALHFPTAGSVCPFSLTIALAENAVDNGVRLSLDTAVLGMECKNDGINAVYTNRGTVYPRVVVNAAGTFADEVAAIAGDEFFTIHPRRGTNAILDKKLGDSIVATIASTMGTTAVGSAHSKGGGTVRTAFGNLLVGPDAVETPHKEDFTTAAASIHATFAKQQNTSEALSEKQIITYFTGVRAASYSEDFIVQKGVFTHNLVHAAGIQSPGLTAAPAIGEAAARMAVELLEEDTPVTANPDFDPVRQPIPHLAALPDAEREQWIAQNPDYGLILCRCEEISRGEVLNALRRSVPCDTVDGVKRRVRPGSGRCQGAFCGPLITRLIAEEKDIALSQVKKSGDGSELLCGATKQAGGGAPCL